MWGRGRCAGLRVGDTLRKTASVASRQHLVSRNPHPAEREQLLPQVFEGGTEVIDGVVEDEEAVVVAVALPNTDGRVLPVMPFQVEFQRFRAATPSFRFASVSSTESSM